jgi:hypothetical protein
MFVPTKLAAIVTFAFLMVVNCYAQHKPTYVVGTVMKIKGHKSSNPDAAKQYDLSVKVRNTLYTVLYTPPPGSNGVEYSAGMERNVLVEGDSMKFSDLRGNLITMPILAREKVVKRTNQAPTGSFQ